MDLSVPLEKFWLRYFFKAKKNLGSKVFDKNKKLAYI